MKTLKKGKLFYPIKYDAAALRLVADMQKQIDEYQEIIDNIFILLHFPKQQILAKYDDKVSDIFRRIIELQKQAETNTKSN